MLLKCVSFPEAAEMTNKEFQGKRSSRKSTQLKGESPTAALLCKGPAGWGGMPVIASQHISAFCFYIIIIIILLLLQPLKTVSK